MIYIASDHAGFELKVRISKFLKKSRIKFEDVGPHEYDEADDYPDFVIPAAQKVAEKPNKNLGIVIGGSGQGEAIASNKVKGIRAAVYYGGPKDIVMLSKTHNNANVLSLGARFMEERAAIKAVKLWLNTKYPKEDRHQRRIQKIIAFESK